MASMDVQLNCDASGLQDEVRRAKEAVGVRDDRRCVAITFERDDGTTVEGTALERDGSFSHFRDTQGHPIDFTPGGRLQLPTTVTVLVSRGGLR